MAPPLIVRGHSGHLRLLVGPEQPLLGWDYSDPETAVIGVALHGLEWLFVRAAPIILIAAIVGIFLTRKKG